ncbi:MAG: hypothetical protein MSC30_11055 [Gaiellaceae bacterium MAG52_C11]|nr:hypothetical protein [Candidatus Gaiellasilicea maunaloa]
MFPRDVARPPQARFDRAIRTRDIYMAELAAIEMERMGLGNARALLGRYAQKGNPKYDRAALKYLARYMAEAAPSLEDVAQTVVLLVERESPWPLQRVPGPLDPR